MLRRRECGNRHSFYFSCFPSRIGLSSVLNYHNIDDPWDVDSNGIFKYAQTQVTNEALIVADEYCIVAGTDTNYPWTNQFNLEEADVPFWQEVTDARFMVVCFVEPVFSVPFIEKLMVRRKKPKQPTAAPAPPPCSGEDCPLVKPCISRTAGADDCPPLEGGGEDGDETSATPVAEEEAEESSSTLGESSAFRSHVTMQNVIVGVAGGLALA